MPLTFGQLEERLLRLPEEVRVRLATFLLASLPVPEGILEIGTPEFEAELERRSANFRNGTGEFISEEDAARELEEMLSEPWEDAIEAKTA